MQMVRATASDSSLDCRSCCADLAVLGAPQAFPQEPLQRPVEYPLVIVACAVISQGERNVTVVKMINLVQS